jgi:hypothetical protein
MAGLDPAIHVEPCANGEMDGRLKGGHDDFKIDTRPQGNP